MAEPSVAARVGILEQTVASLEPLPAQVDALTGKVDTLSAEFLQHREQNAREHAAIRGDIAEMHGLAMARLLEVEDRTSQRFDSLERRMDAGFARADRRFEQIDQRFEQIDERFEQIDQRFEQLERRFHTSADTLAEVLDRLPARRRRKR